jgi:hypothetical protein
MAAESSARAAGEVRSLTYFLPFIDELLAHTAPDHYLDYAA